MGSQPSYSASISGVGYHPYLIYSRSSKMNRKVVVVCGTLAFFGIVSALAGLAAEATKIKASDVLVIPFTCIYPSSPAFGLGLLAAVCAIVNQTIIIIVVGCCSCRPSGSTLTWFSNLFNILSWFATIISVIVMVIGADLNNQEGRHKYHDSTATCYVVPPHTFTVGAVLSLLSAFFGIVAYVCVYMDTRTTSKLEFSLPVQQC